MSREGVRGSQGSLEHPWGLLWITSGQAVLPCAYSYGVAKSQLGIHARATTAASAKGAYGLCTHRAAVSRKLRSCVSASSSSPCSCHLALSAAPCGRVNASTVSDPPHHASRHLINHTSGDRTRAQHPHAQPPQGAAPPSSSSTTDASSSRVCDLHTSFVWPGGSPSALPACVPQTPVRLSRGRTHAPSVAVVELGLWMGTHALS